MTDPPVVVDSLGRVSKQCLIRSNASKYNPPKTSGEPSSKLKSDYERFPFDFDDDAKEPESKPGKPASSRTLRRQPDQRGVQISGKHHDSPPIPLLVCRPLSHPPHPAPQPDWPSHCNDERVNFPVVPAWPHLWQSIHQAFIRAGPSSISNSSTSGPQTADAEVAAFISSPLGPDRQPLIIQQRLTGLEIKFERPGQAQEFYRQCAKPPRRGGKDRTSAGSSPRIGGGEGRGEGRASSEAGQGHGRGHGYGWQGERRGEFAGAGRRPASRLSTVASVSTAGKSAEGPGSRAKERRRDSAGKGLPERRR